MCSTRALLGKDCIHANATIIPTLGSCHDSYIAIKVQE